MHGWGVCSSSDGTRLYEGFWKGGMEHGKGREIRGESLIYEGEWRQGLMHGLGVLRDKRTGQTYEGGFVNDLKEGRGTITEEWGGIIYSQFYEGEFHGVCTYTYDGYVKDVIYREGEVVGFFCEQDDGIDVRGSLAEQLEQWWDAMRRRKEAAVLREKEEMER